MATLWARRATFDTISPGDDFPILVKHVSQQTIDFYRRLASPDRGDKWRDLHTDDEYATRGIFGGTVSQGVATAAYVAELLEKAFPVERLMAAGSRLEMRATLPVRAGDTVTLTGRVTGKRQVGGQGLVEHEVEGTNQKGEVVARARGEIAY